MKRWLVAAMACGAWGCTQPEPTEVDPACVQEPQVASTDESGASFAYVGAVRLLERHQLDTGGTVTGTVGASFYDVRNFSTERPNPLSLSATCVGITGQPAQSGERFALPVTSVDVEGMSSGPLTLTSVDGGPLSHGPVPGIFGGSPVTVRVTGADGGFGSVDFSPLTPPTRVAVQSPDLSGGGTVGNDSLTLKWAAGSDPTRSIQIDLQVGGNDPATRALLSCVVLDDGCHVIESGPLLWLTQDRSDPISITFRRSVAEAREVATSVDGGAAASVSLTTETRGKLTP
ncbi:MAG: hypothetical protein AB2A00_15215 [Myxococcota bacterium]